MNVSSDIISKPFMRDLNSPYFSTHKLTCENWENYIHSKNGLCKNNFNEWGLILLAKYRCSKDVEIKLKSNVLCSPNIITKPKLVKVESTEILINDVKLELENFSIRKSNFFRDMFFKILSSKSVLENGFVSSIDLQNHKSYLNIILSKLNEFKVSYIKYNKNENKLHIKCHKIVTDSKLIEEISFLNVN